MVKNLYLNIDDDVSRALRKIGAYKSAQLVLVVPKGALIFSNPINLQLLKKQTDLMSKTVAILTMDPKGQKYALENGFELLGFEHLRQGGVPMDLGRQHHEVKQAKQEIKKEIKIEPQEFKIPEIIQPQIIQSQQTQQSQTQSVRKIEGLENFAATEAYQQRFNQIITEQHFIDDRNRKKKKSKGGKVFFAFTILALIAFVIITTIILPEADLTVFASTEPFSRDLQVVIDKNSTEPNLQTLTIPGMILDSDQSQTKTYQTQGRIDSGTPASGEVQIYNFTKKTLKLGAKTTILTAGDKIYHFTSDVIGIKPTTYLSAQNINQASLIAPVSVIADQGGDSYNIPAGVRIEIKNNVLGSVPNLLYAQSATNIGGGTSNAHPAISQQDLAAAQLDLSSTIFDAARQQLENSKGFTIAKSGTDVTVKGINFDKQVGDASSSFSGTINAHLTALAYDPTVLKNLIEQRIALSLNADKYLIHDNSEIIKIDYKPGTINFATGNGILDVHIDGVVSSRIDNASIAAAIKGKNALEVKDYLLNNPDINAVNITFKPFWVRTVPRYSGRVYITNSFQQVADQSGTNPATGQ